MKRFTLVIAVVAAAIVVAVGGFWWSQKRSRAYEGMANRFPARTGVFVEIHRLGQWMSPQTVGQSEPSAAQSGRGTDPMLQVLGQVWAAQPVRPAELPNLLKNQPMGIGLWRTGGTDPEFSGAGLIRLGPGQAGQVEKFLAEKLGKKPANVTVDGIVLYKAPNLGDHKGTRDFVWGVSDSQVIMASSSQVAKEVLATPVSKSLGKDHVFQSTVKRFPAEKGALLFVKGDFLVSTIRNHHGKTCQGPTADSGEKKKAEGTPGVTAPNDPEAGSQGTGKPQLSFADLRSALKPILSLDTINAVALWTLPPPAGHEGWETRFWLGFKDPPKGIWRIAAEGSTAYPDMASRLPKNGQLYVWSGGKDPARIYQLSLDELQKDLPPDQMGWIRAGIGAVEGKLGLSFANDLLPALGDQWCVVSSSDSNGSHAKRVGFFLTLRDSRRFEDLLKNKIAPQIHLEQQTYKGAEVWTLGKKYAEKVSPSLVLSGGMAILTNDPKWALSTGGEPGKTYQKFVGIKEKANGLAVIDPALWSQQSDVFTQVVWHSGTSGLSVDAKFPGEAPRWNWKDWDKDLVSLK